jgi:hypothetical protein
MRLYGPARVKTPATGVSTRANTLLSAYSRIRRPACGRVGRPGQGSDEERTTGGDAERKRGREAGETDG